MTFGSSPPHTSSHDRNSAFALLSYRRHHALRGRRPGSGRGCTAAGHTQIWSRVMVVGMVAHLTNHRRALATCAKMSANLRRPAVATCWTWTRRGSSFLAPWTHLATVVTNNKNERSLIPSSPTFASQDSDKNLAEEFGIRIWHKNLAEECG